MCGCEQAGGRREVGQPINKILQGVFDVLTFEAVRSLDSLLSKHLLAFGVMLMLLTFPMQKRKPHLTGSLVVDPQQIYAKLRLFKKDLLAKHGGDKLYVSRSLLPSSPNIY